jgi:peptidoglycan hydrolase-like protein with peptidoglycan-binding domain
MFNLISVPPHEGLPFQAGPPVPDGYIEPDPGVPPAPPGVNLVEAGYTHGARFTYGDAMGSGIPVTAFQAVKDNAKDLIYLGFVIRYDFSFDNDDRIILFLTPSYDINNPPTAHSLNDRRIDILPVYSASQAGGPAGGGAAATPTDPNDYPAYNLRTNKTPREFHVYQRNSAGSPVWKEITSSVANFSVKVRSSEPASGVNYWSVELAIPTKTTGPQAGGGSWIDLSPSGFGLYYNVIRVCSGAGCAGVVLNYDFSTQFTWPYDPANPDAGDLVDPPSGPLDPANWDIPPNRMGQAVILSQGQPNPARGIKFQNGILGIGVRQGPAVSSPISDVVDMTAVGASNTMVGRIINDDPNDPAPQVTALFRLADFGIGGGQPGTWVRIPSSPNPSTPGVVPPPSGGASPSPVDLLSTWVITQPDIDKYKQLWSDQCLWVLLDSPTGANIVEASMRRNLTVHTLSDYEGGFTISGEGYPAAPDGSRHHDFVLHTVRVPIPPTTPPPTTPPPTTPPPTTPPPTTPPPTPPPIGLRPNVLDVNPLLTHAAATRPHTPTVTWIWVTNGYRRTGRVLTIGRRRFAIFSHAGSFGHIFHHELAPGETPGTVDLNFDFASDAIDRRSPSLATVQVPVGGAVTVRTRFTAGPTEEPSTPFNEPILKRGDQGNAVRMLQTCLHGHSQHFGSNHVHDPGPIDGVFGPRTEDSLRSFQANVGSGPVDGVAGPITWSQLDERDTRFPSADLRRGASGNPVRHLQRLLFAAASDPGPVDGIYGDKTAAAVRNFQRKQSLPQTGDADGRTRILLGFVSG